MSETVHEIRQADWWGRCDWCHWPLVDDMAAGCTVDNCSMRPMPKLTEDGKLRRQIRKLVAELEWRDGYPNYP